MFNPVRRFRCFYCEEEYRTFSHWKRHVDFYCPYTLPWADDVQGLEDDFDDDLTSSSSDTDDTDMPGGGCSSSTETNIINIGEGLPENDMPSDGISKVVFGGQVTDEEVESLNNRKPVSGYKLTEITTGSGIFGARKENDIEESDGSGIFGARKDNDVEESDAANPTPNSKTGMYQKTVAGISPISFGEDESVSPKKVLSEAKQRELSGTLDHESDAKLKEEFSNAKNKELSRNDKFAPPPEVKPRPLGGRALAPRETTSMGESPHTNGEPVKTAKKIPSQNFTELSGNNILKGDEPAPSSEKSLSSAKLREMSGSNIFADGKAESRDYSGGVRKPPGGESSIALVL